MNYHGACLNYQTQLYFDHNPVDKRAIFVYGEERLLLLKKEFVGLNEVALYFKVNSEDRYNFVVKKGNEKMEIVRYDQYFTDILEAISVYTEYTNYPDFFDWVPKTNDNYENKKEEELKNKRQARFGVDSREKSVKREKKVFLQNDDKFKNFEVGTVTSWNNSSAYGIIKIMDRKETLLFHVTGKKSNDWIPVKGQMVKFKSAVDKIKKETIAVNVSLCMDD